MAPPTPTPPTHITLRIKVPPGHIQGDAEEYTLASPIAVTVKIGALRDQIQTSLPTNPAPERQRLLYAGRALVDNDQTVGDALNIRREPTQTEYVVHLLVRGGSGEGTAPRITTPIEQAAPGSGLAQQYQQHQQAVNPLQGPSLGVEQMRMLHQEHMRAQRQFHGQVRGGQQNAAPHVNVAGVPVSKVGMTLKRRQTLLRGRSLRA